MKRAVINGFGHIGRLALRQKRGKENGFMQEGIIPNSHKIIFEMPDRMR